MTRGSQTETVAILWYEQAWRIRPQQIHNNFLESLGYSKQRWYLLITVGSKDIFCRNSIVSPTADESINFLSFKHMSISV